MAQLGARFHGMEEVIGSIPIRSTNSFNILIFAFLSGMRRGCQWLLSPKPVLGDSGHAARWADGHKSTWERRLDRLGSPKRVIENEESS